MLAAFDLDIGAAELAVMAALDLAAELGGHGHLAVADAEHRHAGIEDQLAARAGEPSSCTDSGPPERITAFGFISLKAASAFWNGTISE